jgi:hypothetical protein
VKVDKLITVDIGAMLIFATFLALQFEEPAIVFYVSIMLTVSVVLARLLTARLITNVGLQHGLAGGALSN